MRLPVLQDLLQALGPSTLRPASARRDSSGPVSGTLIHEPRAALPPLRHGLLLAVGVQPAGPEAMLLARQAAQAGYTALVVKSFGEPATELAAVANDAGIALLVADDEAAWHHLDALISSALEALARGADGRSATPVGDLFTLANAIAASVGGATTIEDPQQQILAYSRLPEQAIDETRRRGILGLQVPYHPVNESQYRELARTSRACRFAADRDELPRLAIAVRAGNELLGSIWVVDANDGLPPEAERALADASDIAALHMLAARTGPDLARRHRADLLRRLLADPASASLAAPQLGLNAEAPVAVAAFIISSRDIPDTLHAHATTRLIDLVNLHGEAHYGRHGCALIDGAVYLLMPVSPAGMPHRDLVTDIARRAQRALNVPIRAGLGTGVAGLHLAARSRQEADLALRVVEMRQPDPGEPAVAAIDDVRSAATLTELADAVPQVLRLAEGAAAVIRTYDREHQTAYAQTLLEYFNANGDISKTARLLGLHPNSCRYRLARATEIFGLDLTDPDERLVLWLQLRIGGSMGR